MVGSLDDSTTGIAPLQRSSASVTVEATSPQTAPDNRAAGPRWRSWVSSGGYQPLDVVAGGTVGSWQVSAEGALSREVAPQIITGTMLQAAATTPPRS
jgi:hypothetical protein